MATLSSSIAALVDAHDLRPVLAELVRANGLLVVLEHLANIEAAAAETCLARAENNSAYDHNRSASVVLQAAQYISRSAYGITTTREREVEPDPQQQLELGAKKKTRARGGMRA